ncbi:MAG: hypothetical protein AAGD33_14145 [Actinomycetota bacterium]
MSQTALLHRPDSGVSPDSEFDVRSVRSITIAPHHNGPTGSGHGGVFAGRLAALVGGGPVAVRLQRPVPLATELLVEVAPDGSHAVRRADDDTGEVIATARRVDPLPDPAPGIGMLGDLRWVPGVPLARLETDHPCPTCFACGTERQDGLRLRPHLLGGVCVASWTPEFPGVAAGDVVPDWMVWAALDCGSAGPALDLVVADQAILTGELIADVRWSARASTDLLLTSQVIDRDGRRTVTEVALLAHDEVLAVARATWITVDRAVLERLARPSC